MGYYSEVALVTSKDAYSRLLAAVAKYPEATKFVIDAIENDKYGHEPDENMLFHWPNVKWYQGHSRIIDAIEDWMDGEDGTNSYDEEYQFLRLGESNDDAEERGNYDYGLAFSRNLEFLQGELQ